MDNVPLTSPLANPGVEAALVRFGHAVKDFAESRGEKAPEPYTDKIAISSALIYLGTSAICTMSPTTAVTLLDDMCRRVGDAAASAQS